MSAVGARELPGVAVWRRRVVRLLTYLGLAVIAIVMLYPFWSMGIASFRSLEQFQLGHGFSLTSWKQLFHTLPVGHQLASSTIVTVGAIALILAVSTTAGYAFGVLRYRFSTVLFLLIMYMQGPRGLSPIHASLLLVPGYVLGSVAGPYAGRLADRRGPVLPATAGLAIQVAALAIYAQLTNTTGLWVVVLASIINGIGASFFFPANSSAVMKAAPPEAFGIASGMLRTFANIGMVFSFAVAILIASRSISRGLAFAIFVGSTSLHGRLAVAFTSGLHAAFYASMGFMALAAGLSALRAGSGPRSRV